MEKSMELLWAKLEDKLNQQTLSITTAVTSNVMEALNEKMESIIKENKYLKNQIETLEQKVEKMETEKRKNNLVFFGLEEKGKRESELVEYIKEIVTKTGIHLDSQEIANVYRIGAQSQKNHPVVVTLTTLWKKHLLLKNKAKFASGIYIKEDYSKNVLAIRKQLQPQVEEERKKGNIAYIKHDKLVVKKPNDPGREKRKREHTASPNSPTHRRPNPNIENMPSTSTPAFTSTPGAKEIIKPSMLNYVTRGRSSSLSDVPKKPITTPDSRKYTSTETNDLLKLTNQKCTPSRLVTVGEADYYPPIVNKKQPHKKSRHTNVLHIITYNTLSLRTNEKLTELMLGLENVNWSIIGLSEVRRLGESIEDYGGFIFYYRGDIPGKYGIGFLIRKELENNINELIGISDRIAILNIKLPPLEEMWSIVQIYSPTEQSTNTEIDSFYYTLTDAIRNHTCKNLIVMGDFNAQIGSRKIGEEIVLGPHSSGKRSRNGEKLIQFAYENNLKILNSQFKNRPNNRWTWESPDGSYKNEIDFILSNRNTAFNDCRVVNRINFNSNHRALRAKLALNTHKQRPFKVKQKNTNIFLEAGKLKENVENFNEITKDLNMQDKYNTFLELLSTKAAKESPGLDKKLPWLSEKTKTLLKDRSKLISTPNKTKHIRKIIAETSKQINISIRKEKEIYRLDKIEQCIQKTGGVKKAVKQLTEKRDWIPKMTCKAGKNLTIRADINSLATNFFKNLYSSKCNFAPTDLTKEDTVPNILLREVEKAISSQKKDKAPGLDYITNEFLIRNKETLAPILTYIFNEVLNSELIPDQWTTSTIALLHKKGSKDDINNYRPISLMSNIYKVFAKVILSRITKILDENQPREQAGFRSGYSTLDHIFVVKQLFERSNEYNTTFYCCFVDYSKAFDSLEHEAIWRALKNQGVENKYIRVIKNIYRNSKARIKLEKEGEEIKLERGVRQGDPISPKLFTAVLEEIFRQMNWEKQGLRINGENLSHLRFADDIVIFAETKNDLEIMLNELDKESRKVGLTMNTQKTKVMTNGSKIPICINEIPIEYVEEYIYLGQIISMKDLAAKEIERRIGNAWKRFWSLREILKNKEIKMAIKRKLFNICILPVLTYGCQTWSLTKAKMKKLETCQNAMNRSMMGKRLKDRIRITTLNKHTKTKNVTMTIKKLKWRWAGHTIRGRDKWSKTLMNWFTAHLKRKRGRPAQRWVDEIRAVAGGTWTRTAGDRNTWRQLEEAFAHQRQTDQDIEEQLFLT